MENYIKESSYKEGSFEIARIVDDQNPEPTDIGSQNTYTIIERREIAKTYTF